MNAVDPLLPTNDDVLLSAIAMGDQTAFAQFYDRHCDRVFGLLRTMLRDNSRAEDVLQEVFLQVWNRAGTFDAARAAPVTWLTVIARSRARDQMRRVVRQADRGLELPELESGETPASSLEQSDLAGRALLFLKNLPAEQELAIRRAFFDGLSNSEIADMEGLPLGTVKTRIRQGMMKLRDLMGVEA